jgi:hypothetical protein
LRILPSDGLSNLLHLSTPPTTNAKYLYYVNAEPIRKQPLITTTSVASTNARQKLSVISLPVPWYRRTRSPSDDKSLQKSNKMSLDRLLPLDRLFSSGTHTPTDEEQVSPTNDLTLLDESMKFNEKNIQQIKENGHLRNSSHLATR